jgi:hypothetical protein
MQDNLAHLVDLVNWFMQTKYASWTVDPDSRDYRDEARRRKAQGWKPPPFPLIAPVANRPASLHQQHMDAYEALVEQYRQAPAADDEPVYERGRLVSSTEFDRALGF